MNRFKGMDEMDVKSYLASIMPTREMVDHFVRPHDASLDVPVDLGGVMCNNAKSTFDPELGWVLCDGVRGGSVDGSRGFYGYEADGSRRVVNFPDRACRVHTYGNSFTHCDQVSDGETWQEYLAAHLQEPIKNYGIGGYSVYQAYRRMRKVEAQTPADYIILNIWDDDHFRNLDAWRSIRSGRPGRFTLPCIRVNLKAGTCEEFGNLCKTPEEVYRLCDPEWVWETFRQDPILHAVMARKGGSAEAAVAMAESLGATAELENAESDAELYRLHTEAALLASRHVVALTEQFVEAQAKKLMLILSFSRRSVADALAGKPSFDRTFLDWLVDKDYPVIDLREAFVADYAMSKADIDTYLDRFYIGHHTPAGNFTFAWAIKDPVCNWLHPKPLPYR